MAKKKKAKPRASSSKRGQDKKRAPSAGNQSEELPGLVKPGEPLPYIDFIALFLVFGLLFLFLSRQVSSLDVGFHLKAGNYILSGNGWPTTDPFSYTYTDHKYIDSQWGYQVILAIVNKVGDSAGIVLFHTAIVLSLFYLLYRTARLMPIDPPTVLSLFLLSVAATELRYIVRPEALSWVFLAGVLYILHRYAQGLKSPLCLLPVTQLIWVNCHSGFVMGWGAIGCFTVGLWLKRNRLDTLLLKWGAISVVACLINPYHIEGILFPFDLLTRFRPDNPFSQSIGEFVSPFAVFDRASTQFPFYPYTVSSCSVYLFLHWLANFA